MSNIFNDLNKLVNTVQKVDKLLTEKPKQVRFNKSFTLEEVNFFYRLLQQEEDKLVGVDDNGFYPKTSIMIDKLKKKLK